MQVFEDLTLGIDLGIGSCGWAIIRRQEPGSEILALGTRTFDVPETDKERTPTNRLRREFRGQRRVIGRKRQRMNAVRALFRRFGLIETDGKDALKPVGHAPDPREYRAAGLDRKLSGFEFAVALGHIAKHRGFKSNSKRDKGANAPKDSSDMLKAIEATRKRLKSYRTAGEMLVRDSEFRTRKRNRDGDYSRSILRDDLEREVRLLFDRQRAHGSDFADETLETAFIETAFFQRPLADSEHMVGDCPFEKNEKRAAKRSYSFELFRLLSRLAALRVRSGRTERPLTPQEMADASADFGTVKGLTFKRLRKIVGLGDDECFDGVPPEEEGKRDVVTRSGNMAAGTYALRNVLGDVWKTLVGHPTTLDGIAHILSFREDIASIRAGLSALDLEPLVLDTLMRGVEEGAFSEFKGAGHISAKACRNIIPYLKRGLVYSDACKEANYVHSDRPQAKLEDIANPIARKALTEALKQVRAIVNEFGLPGRIHVELARDVGKSKEERDEIRFGIERRNKEKDRLKECFENDVGRSPSGVEDMLRYELWREQNGRCVYTDETIHPDWIVASDNRVQVDHILPWSRSGDDSFVNKTLCLAKANQDKKGRTPFEWFYADKTKEEWDSLVARVETNKAMKGRKKRNYLLKDASILEEKFRNRNLNDTRYASRLLADELARLYLADGKRRVFARPGALTDRLRRGWGLQGLKKDADGKRIPDDKHHALDALIVAATSEGALNTLTRAFQASEAVGGHRDFSRLEPPWPGFVAEAHAKLSDVFVSRAERHRARGKGHDATIRQVSERDGRQIVFERKSVDALSEKDLERIKDPERNARLREALRAWIAEGKPKDKRPLSPKGDPVSKVRLGTSMKVNVLVRDGAADRGDMVRVDVFRKRNKKNAWEFFFVPVYPHQVADRTNFPQPPNYAIRGGKEESEWPEITTEHEFLWSLNPLSFIEVTKSDGEVIEGYFRSMDRSTGALTISPQHTNQEIRKGIGGRTLKSLRKFHVDRLGRRHEITREKRTWHGAVCT